MNPLRSKRIIIPTAVAAGVLAIGGTAWAVSANGSDNLSGSDLDRASKAAVTEAGGGKVTKAERGDDKNDAAYEVEVTKEDGTEIDVDLDKNFNATRTDDDSDDRGDHDSGDDSDGADSSDDQPLPAAERTKAEAAAVKAVGGGTVVDAEAGSGTEAYEVDVRTSDGQLWKVELDANYAVLEKELDD